MIGSGITTVQHIQGWMPGSLPDVEKRGDRDHPAPTRMIGMRVSYCYAVRDQNRLVYQADEEFVRQPAEGAAGPDAALVRPLQDAPRRLRWTCSSRSIRSITTSAG